MTKTGLVRRRRIGHCDLEFLVTLELDSYYDLRTLRALRGESYFTVG